MDEDFDCGEFGDDDGYCDCCDGSGWIVCPECNRGATKEPFPQNLPGYAVDNGWTPTGGE